MNRSGYSIVEVVIALLIMSIVSVLSYPLLLDLLSASKIETTTAEAHLDKIVNLELLRLDLEHTGFGIAKDEPVLPMAWDATEKKLTLYSSMNNTNQKTIGWVIYDCTASAPLSTSMVLDKRQDSSHTALVLLNSEKRFALRGTTAGYCPEDKIYTGFPYNNSSNHCDLGGCTGIQYRLSSSSVPSNCSKGTKNLIRVPGAGGSPILNCVADYTVTFDVDLDGNNRLSAGEIGRTDLPGTTTEILEQVKQINFYILLQTSRRDKTLKSKKSYTIDNITLSNSSVTNPSDYRWKIQKISAKPMSW